MKYFAAVIALCLISGCASVETKYDRRDCEKVIRPGSNVPIYRC